MNEKTFSTGIKLHKLMFFIDAPCILIIIQIIHQRCTYIKTLIKIYIKVSWLLHVSVYDHHQGACN